MSDTSGRRSPTLSECTVATESTIPFWPPQEKIPPYNEIRQPSQAVLSTLEHKFVSMKTAYDNFDKWLDDSGDVQAACDAQWDSSSLAKTKPREWVEMRGVCLRVIGSGPEVLQFVHPPSAEHILLLDYPKFVKSTLTIDDKLEYTRLSTSGFTGRMYAKRLVVAPGLTEVGPKNKMVRRWKIMTAELYTPEYLLRRPDLHELP